MTKVVLAGYILVSNSDLEAVLNELSNHIHLSRREKGCLVFEVTQDSEDPTKFNVYEEFVDQDSFARHQDRVSQSTWGMISKNASRHYQVTVAD